MHDKRDDYEPIIATRRSREPLSEDTQPIWQIVLAIVGFLILVAVLAWWWTGRTPSDSGLTKEGSEASTSEVLGPTEEVEQQVVPPARDPDSRDEVIAPKGAQSPSLPEPAAEDSSEQPVVPESEPEAVASTEPPPPATPALVSVRFVSPDPQVQLELHRLIDTSSPVLVKVGDEVSLAPGPYRVVATGAQLDKFEQEVTFDGDAPAVYMVELCARRTPDRESIAGQVVEERACASTPECESMFTIMGEYADELVRDRDFRTQQCGKWRDGAVPDGSWTLNINCGGATLATTCRIEIAEGGCTFAGPRRTARGTACPRAELK